MKRVLVILFGVITGCQPSLEHQPKLNPFAASSFFANGSGARAQPEGTLPYLAEDETTRPPLTQALLRRGQDRFAIYCTACHGWSGEGNGMAVQRGFPAPPSFHNDTARNWTDQHIFTQITVGNALMRAFAAEIAPTDRWAIIAYIRALQLSRHAARKWLSAADLQNLKESQ